jgi:hypothetical protein
MYVKRHVARKWKCGRKRKGKGLTQRSAEAAQRGAEKNIVLLWAMIWPMQKQPLLCGLRVTFAPSASILSSFAFILCLWPVFRLLFVGYKKMRHKKADMARRAKWLKIVNIRINKGRNNFRKILRMRKKRVCKSYF